MKKMEIAVQSFGFEGEVQCLVEIEGQGAMEIGNLSEIDLRVRGLQFREVKLRRKKNGFRFCGLRCCGLRYFHDNLVNYALNLFSDDLGFW